MMRSIAMMRWASAGVIGALALGAAGMAGAAPQAGGGGAKGVGDLGSSKEPIAIDADRLDGYDKEGRAVFTGNVIAVQGDATMKCTLMVVFYEQKRGTGTAQSGAAGTGASAQTAAATQPQQPASGGNSLSDSAIKKIDCKGPVTINTKTQTATGDRAEFDRVVNKVFVIGNAVLSDGPNVTRGERVAYDLTTGVANVEGGRVKALIVPSSDQNKDGKGDKDDKKGKPKS